MKKYFIYYKIKFLKKKFLKKNNCNNLILYFFENFKINKKLLLKSELNIAIIKTKYFLQIFEMKKFNLLNFLNTLNFFLDNIIIQVNFFYLKFYFYGLTKFWIIKFFNLLMFFRYLYKYNELLIICYFFKFIIFFCFGYFKSISKKTSL